MSKFTKSYTNTLNFEDDTVVLVMTRMKRKDVLKLIPYMGDIKKSDAPQEKNTEVSTVTNTL